MSVGGHGSTGVLVGSDRPKQSKTKFSWGMLTIWAVVDIPRMPLWGLGWLLREPRWLVAWKDLEMASSKTDVSIMQIRDMSRTGQKHAKTCKNMQYQLVSPVVDHA